MTLRPAIHRGPNSPASLLVIVVAVVLLAGIPIQGNAQRIYVGAGIGAASVARSLAPLCGSARRLNGPTFTAQAGLHAGWLRVAASADYTARGYHEAAECIPRSGTVVDSIFASAGTTALSLAADVWLLAARHLNLGGGAGWVPDHQSWFVSGGVGSQYRKLRAEVMARWHRTSFEVITREYTSQGVREISRSAHTENSWGGIVRVLLVTR